MKYILECDVDSRTELFDKDPLEIPLGDRIYVFEVNDQHIICRIKIIAANVAHPEKFASTLELDEKGVMVFQINRDVELHDSMIDDFQQIESMVAFLFSLNRIHWESARWRVEPENQQEAAMANIFTLDMTKMIDRDPVVRAGVPQLQSIVENKDRFVFLKEYLSFWREAKSHNARGNYIDAIRYCYFILEGMFGNGETKNAQVKWRFKNSPELTAALQWCIDDGLAKAPTMKIKIDAMLKFYSKKADVSGLVHLIVETRGRIQHYTQKNSSAKSTPFDHAEYD